MKSKIILGLLALLLMMEFALAAYAILAHQWLGLAVVTLLIFAVMYLMDREARRMAGDVSTLRRSAEDDSTTRLQGNTRRGKKGSRDPQNKPRSGK